MRTTSALWSSWGPSPQLRTFPMSLFIEHCTFCTATLHCIQWIALQWNAQHTIHSKITVICEQLEQRCGRGGGRAPTDPGGKLLPALSAVRTSRWFTSGSITPSCTCIEHQQWHTRHVRPRLMLYHTGGTLLPATGGTCTCTLPKVQSTNKQRWIFLVIQ